ncbi:MAG: hypothetical protein ABFD50_12760 [Smithella sp.]
MNSVQKTQELIAKCEAFVKDLKDFRKGCDCPENILTQEDWNDATVVVHAESLIDDVGATIVIMREEIE